MYLYVFTLMFYMFINFIQFLVNVYDEMNKVSVDVIYLYVIYLYLFNFQFPFKRYRSDFIPYAPYPKLYDTGKSYTLLKCALNLHYIFSKTVLISL